jgi:hypothetical protein
MIQQVSLGMHERHGARCRSRAGLLTGGPKSLISWLTGRVARG